MKAKNRIGLLAKLLGGGFIVSFAFFMFTNATENPLDNNFKDELLKIHYSR